MKKNRALLITLILVLGLSIHSKTFAKTPFPAAELMADKTFLEIDQTKPQIEEIDNTLSSQSPLSKQLGDLQEMQNALNKQIAALKAKIEYQESSIQNTNASVEELQKSVGRTKKLFKSTIEKGIQWSGYVHGGYRIYNNAPRTPEFIGANGENSSSFSMRRVVFTPKVIFNDKFRWESEFEIEDLGNDFIGMERSEFIYKLNDYVNFRAGLIMPSLSETNFNHEPFNRNLVDYPLVDAFITPVVYRDLGVGVFGTVPIKNSNANIKYEANILHGFTDILAPNDYVDGTPISSSIKFKGLRDGRPHRGANSSHFKDNNANKAIHGRVTFAPCKNFQIGTMVHTGALGSKGNNLTLIGADAKFRYKKFSTLFEYATAIFNRDNEFNRQGVNFRNFPTNMNGFHVEPAYDVTDKLTVVGAYGEVDLDEGNPANTTKRASVGFKYKLFPNVFFKGEYQFTAGRRNLGSKKFSNAVISEISVKF